MKRAALCLSGHLRNFEQTGPRFQHLLDSFSEYELDVYLATWNQLDTSDGPKGVEGRWPRSGEIQDEAVMQFYRPLDCYSGDYEVWRPEFHWSKFMATKPVGHPAHYYIVNDVLICAPQLYLIWRANSLIQGDYDIVVRARPDFLPHKPFSIKESDDILFPILYRERGRVHALDDRFCYGPAAKMKVFANLWHHLKYVIESYDPAKFPYEANENNCQHLSCERIMHRWLVENSVSFGEHKIELGRA